VHITNPNKLNIDGVVEIFLLSLICVWTDIHTRKIPNEYLLYAGLLGITFQIKQFNGVELLEGLANCILVMIILFPLYRFRVLGAGDIKLLSVWGIKYSLKLVGTGFLFSLYIGAAIGLVAWCITGNRKIRIPFSPAIFAGMVIAICTTCK